jgi:hypothetical protein
MRIETFRPSTEGDFPAVKDKEIFEVIAPVQKVVKDLVTLSQRLVGRDNLNEELIQVDLTPDTWTTIELHQLKGAIMGIYPILVDHTGYMTGWAALIVDEKHINVKIDVDGSPTTVTTRILVKGY